MPRKRSSGTLIVKRKALREELGRPDGGACLIRLHPPGPELGQRTALERSEYVIGRQSGADLVLESDSVSRRHARLLRGEEGDWSVEDLGSTNGSFVNEERADRRMLRDGDQLRFGDVIFKFLVGTNVESAYHEEIYRMTILDALTGVHNKRYFAEFLEREQARSSRHGHDLTLVVFDIDHFKLVNDQHGHLAGDAVLRELAARVKPRIRREDLFARCGGEEFAAILTVTPLAGGLAFAEQVRALVADKPFDFEGVELRVTVSAGVASTAGRDPAESDDVFRRADENLYAAKRAGRNRVVG